MQRDEIVRRDRRPRVVERAGGVVERERTQSHCFGEPDTDLASFGRLGCQGGPGAVELLRSTRARERLERMKRETARVRLERRQRRGAGDVRHPGPDRQLACHRGDHLVRHAEQNEPALRLHADPFLAQPAGDG